MSQFDLVTAGSEWVAQARCRERDPEELFVRGAAQKHAAVICRACPVIVQCAVEALDNRIEFGVWGGMTERQRRALLKRYPQIDKWADVISCQTDTRTLSRLA